MCAITAAPALLFVLLVATLSINIMCGSTMAVEGLPMSRQVREAGDYEDILAGNDFLSVFLESTLHRLKKETTTLEIDELDLYEESLSTEPYLRETREAANYFTEVPQSTERQLVLNKTSDSLSSDGVIIGVHVSSSIGSQINKNSHFDKVSLDEKSTQSHNILDQNILPSEEHPSIIANSGKSELNVEEPTPITKDNDEDNISPTIDLFKSANIQNLPSTNQHIAFNPTGFANVQNKNNLSPYHHSVIYHDNPNQPGRARSVSYSTIIQDIQPANEKPPSNNHERKERNYETGTIFRNSYELPNEKTILNSNSNSKDYNSISTTPPSSTPTWQVNNQESSTTPKIATTEKNWAKPYSSSVPPIPKVYGRPEQNFEIDESVSVVTNGRTHGVQSFPSTVTEKPKSDQDKDQKVGYVVEGRNYRKYRVEERTSDGFIVGEYGVVSHDDGTLRGVRYTADGTINPRLIYDALMKFLAL